MIPILFNFTKMKLKQFFPDYVWIEQLGKGVYLLGLGDVP